MREAHKILMQYLNIDTNDTNVNYLILGDLQSLPDGEVAPFVAYVKEKCNDKNLDYKTGFQKFNYLIERFKLHRVQLTEKENQQIYNYNETLTSKIEIIFEKIEEQLYKNNVSPLSSQAKNYLESSALTKNIIDYIEEKGLKVVDKVGRAELCRLVRSSRYTLKAKIKQAITDLTKEKKILTLGYSGAIGIVNQNQKMIGSN